MVRPSSRPPERRCIPRFIEELVGRVRRAGATGELTLRRRNRHHAQREPGQNTRCDGQVLTHPTGVDNGNMPIGLSSTRARGITDSGRLDRYQRSRMPSDRSRVRSESPTRLEVRLLGAVEVILDGRRLGAFNTLRLQRFLALITLRRDLQHRSRLAFELWPDSDERQARTNLRKLLHDVRHSLPDVGEFVEIDNEIVRWIPTGPSEVDALRF